MKNAKEKSIMIKWRAWGIALVLLIGAPAVALAQSVIQSITSSQQSGSDVVRIELSEALTAVPAGFVIQAPPRIAIDLPGIGSALARHSVEINQGNLRSVNVAQAGERTRLVLSLKQAATYRAQLDGKALLKIPAETQSGQVFRLKNKGIRPVRGSVTGDLFCHVQIETPVNLNSRQKELLREFEEIREKNAAKQSPKQKGFFDKLKDFFEG